MQDRDLAKNLQRQQRPLWTDLNRRRMLKWLLIILALASAFYSSRAMVLGLIPLRLPLVVMLGVFWLVAAWRWGPLVLLAPAAFFIWYEFKPVSYFFLESVFFHGYFAEMVCYATLLFCWMRRGMKLFQGIPYLPLLALFALFAFVDFFIGIAPDKEMSWQVIRWSILAPISMYIIIVGGLRRQRDVERLVLSFLLGSLALAVLCVLAYVGYFPKAVGSVQPFQDLVRLYGAYQVPLLGYMVLGGNLTVMFASFAMPLALSLWLHSKGKGEKLRQWIGLAVLVTNFVALVVSASRLAWAGMLVACILVVLLSQTRIQRGSLTRVGIIAAILVGSYMVLDRQGYISTVILDRASSLLPGLSSPLAYWEESAGGRGLAWQLIGPTMRRYPLGTGFLAGIEGYAAIGGPFQGLHSQYLMLLTGTGVVGTAAFLLFLLLCIHRCIQGRFIENATSRWLAIGVAGSIVTYFFSALMYSTSAVFGVDIALLMICGAGVAAVETSRLTQTDDPKASV